MIDLSVYSTYDWHSNFYQIRIITIIALESNSPFHSHNNQKNCIGVTSMLKIIKPFVVFISMIPLLTLAHGPSRQKVVEEIEINASPDKVWEIIADYCSIKVWNPSITACESDSGSQPESIRTITLENGEQVKEKLVKYDPENFKIQYMMIEKNAKAMPIDTHGSTLMIKSSDSGGSVVIWKGAFYRSFPGPNPPPDQTDEAGKKIITDLYKSGLENIKILAE